MTVDVTEFNTAVKCFMVHSARWLFIKLCMIVPKQKPECLENKCLESVERMAERFCELTTISCKADEINHSLLATNNESPYQHSFNVPSWAECFIMFKSFFYIKSSEFVFCNTGNHKSRQILG